MSSHLRIQSANGRHCATVSTLGARLLQWSFDERELIFAPASITDDERVAQHGGIPVLFPQFGLFGPGRKHGVVRDMEWDVETHAADSVRLRTRIPQDVHGDFELTVQVNLHKDGPVVHLSAVNVSDQAVEITCGLHTYVRVPDIREVELHGLEHTAYEDALNGLMVTPASERVLSVPINVDRVYTKTPPSLMLKTPDYDIAIEQSGFGDTVVWNPGPAIASGFVDLLESDWQAFLCVEAAQIRPPLTLEPRGTWHGSQQLRVVRVTASV